MSSEDRLPIYRDTKSGLKVTGILAMFRMFGQEAQGMCPAGYHVPSAGIKDWNQGDRGFYDPNNQTGEFATLNTNGIRDVIPGMREKKGWNHWFWSSSLYGKHDDYNAFSFEGTSGAVYPHYYYVNEAEAVVCVAER